MKKVKGKQVILSFVCLVLGFMISFSYQYAKDKATKRNVTDRQWQKEYEYRQQLIEQQKENRKLEEELIEKQQKVQQMEKSLASEKKTYTDLVKEAEQLRMYTGKIAVKGKGIEVTLSDASYIPSEQSATDYIVHEQHVFKVIHELLISGAEAIAINGQRISHRSYIMCNGPVIEVDGIQHSAPFVISAIGDPDVLTASLNIAGGVKDQLVNDNIVVKIVSKDEITLDPIFHTE
ncbi:DUF881 domain-containing protein [Thermaerobacillus caldiproteolyticus]|uniref:Uncharacterized protein YlxW (UPF0749 family) n=1 Tax=Thermaerobacillus caldiproteolyticus TaxID=247480 RepID=A0A7V9Z544_9BACL|nr:DUF881 domain-containing protein [Anoxybacillus caldiproteolyticus]MBA2874080.1 uncharacterized protein YlxW (UPF0749 family) [Anoxybacillus caldiproteolyticus]QPA31965.1 DUF881 domain-containing protein [Anoxybacillus caldiproteolyticus]